MFLFILGRLPLKRNYIVFESYPELDGSPWMIYQELIKRNYDKKYKLIWFTDANYKNLKNTPCIHYFQQTNWRKIIQNYWILAKAKAVIENNRFLYRINSKTFRLHTQHGAPLKNCIAYTWNIGNIDAILSLSESTATVEKRIFPNANGKIIPLGYPANDQLFNDIDLQKIGFWKECSKSNSIYHKIIGWLPTYRQHKNNLCPICSNVAFPFGIPLLYSRDMFNSLNECLKRNNDLLVIQMHPAQAKNFPLCSYSNIVLISTALKEKYNVTTANMMHNFDALITDYSAAYHEFLLLNRPIALSIDDYNEYAKKPGFSLNYFDWIKGVYLKNVSDLIKFIEDVSKGFDSAKREREKAMHQIHKYTDNHSTQRVVNFLIKKAGL